MNGGFGVTGQVTVAVNVNGTPISIKESGYNEVNIFSNTLDVLPSATISFEDLSGELFDTMSVSSGTPFEVTVGNGDSFKTIGFKVSGVPSIKRRDIRTTYQINGVFDKLKYVMDRPKIPYPNMPSMAACSAIASDCGLKPEIHSTNDKMTWFAGPNQTFADFLHSIVDRGYKDEKSIMATAVLDSGVLRYKNLTQVMKEGSKKTFQQGYNEGVLITGYEIADHMGLGNMKMNHGLRLVQEQLTGEANKLINFAIPLLSSSLGMNAGDKKGMNNARTEYAAPDLGNTFKEYKQAEYQNKRGRVSFGVRVYVLCKEMVEDVDIFDLVDFRVRNPSTGNPSIYNGKYIVFSKRRVAKGSLYHEIYELASQGIDGDHSGQFLSPSSMLKSFNLGF